MLNNNTYLPYDTMVELCKVHDECRFYKDILEFSQLKSGWLDGNGERFDEGFLLDVLTVLDINEKQLDGFNIYPIPCGWVQLEREFAGWDISIRLAYYPDNYSTIWTHALHYKSGNVVEAEDHLEWVDKHLGILKYIKKCDALYKKRLEKKARLNDPRY